jgi:hypothetical protein
MPSGASHRGVAVCGCAVNCFTVFLVLVTLASFRRRHQYPKGIKARCLAVVQRQCEPVSNNPEAD